MHGRSDGVAGSADKYIRDLFTPQRLAHEPFATTWTRRTRPAGRMRPPGNAFAPREVAAHSPSAPIGLPRAGGARNLAPTPHRCIGHADDVSANTNAASLPLPTGQRASSPAARISADLTIAEPFRQSGAYSRCWQLVWRTAFHATSVHVRWIQQRTINFGH